MKRIINKTKWKKIKKNYQRVMQTVTLDESNGSVFITQHYRERLNEKTCKGSDSLNSMET